MSMRGCSLAMSMGTLCMIVACGGPLSEGKSEFKKGRYAEAHQTFVRLEPDFRGMDDKKRAEYALYRGLTHGALGDRPAALVWLREAKTIEDLHPGTLSSDDATRLRLGIDSLEPHASDDASATP